MRSVYKIMIFALALCISLSSCALTFTNKVDVESSIKEKLEKVESETEDKKLYAPDFTVYGEDGEKVSLYEKLGGPIILNFWATWCPPCKSELPAFDDAAKQFEGEIEFMMINITDGERDTKEIVDAFITENGYSFPLYYDMDLNAAYTYGASSIPLTVFINADGTVFNAVSGAMSEQTLQTYINAFIENNR